MYIDLDQVLFFIVLVVAGSLYGYHCYRQGIQRGIDEIINFLEEEEIIYIDPETGEIERY